MTDQEILLSTIRLLQNTLCVLRDRYDDGEESEHPEREAEILSAIITQSAEVLEAFARPAATSKPAESDKTAE